jgi:dethiobiotin synthetase
VTGTDTGVGKTLVAAALAMVLRQRGVDVGVMKPVETGVTPQAPDCDAARLQVAAGTADPSDIVCPYSFGAPLAPVSATREIGLSIDPDKIEMAFKALTGRHTWMLVEGVGGVRVPIGEKFEVRDLIRRLGLPAVIVGRTALGGINHALLTVESLERYGVPVLALVLNGRPAIDERSRVQADSTVEVLRQHAGCRVLGPLPYVAEQEDWQTVATIVSRHAALLRLADLVTSSAKTS